MNRQKEIIGMKEPKELPLGRAAKQCPQCNRWFTLPKCHAARHTCCSAECRNEIWRLTKEKRSQECEVCGESYVPRANLVGTSRFCSVRCMNSVSSKWIRDPKHDEKRIAAIRSREYKTPSGPENPLWKGGPKAALRRRIRSGKSAAYCRKYRERNPERVREWRQKRDGGKRLSKLPYGTIPKLLQLQKGLCAYCQKDVRQKYHVDHITPIDKGGRHEPNNLQILCPSCNLEKWAHDPIDFAQSRGLLL